MSLVTTVAAQLTALLSNPNSFGTAAFSPGSQLTDFLDGTLDNGTGGDKADQFYVAQTTLAASGSASLNLSTMGGALDLLGNALSFATIKGLAIKVLGNLGCKYVSAAVVNAAGASYLINDVLTVAGGTGTAATIKVLTVGGGGAILTVLVLTVGSYTVNPTTTANAVTGGTGTGATINLTMTTVVAATPPTFVEADVLTIGNVGTTAGWTSFLAPNGATLSLKGGTLNLPGTLMAVEGGGTGWVVGASSTNNILKIVNSGTNPVTYLLAIIGATA